MARTEGYDGAPEILTGGGREWPAAWTSFRTKIATVVLVALTLAAIGGFYLGTLRAPPPPARVADDPVLVRIPGGPPSGAAYAAGSVWVMTWDGFAVRVDPTTRAIQARVAVGEGPLATREGFGSVWVTSSAEGAVARIDPVDNSVLATIEVGPAPYQLAPAGGGMWVATQEAAVKIDPNSNRVVQRTPYPHARSAQPPSTAGVGLAADERAVWVSTPAGTVLRLRPGDGHLVSTIRVLEDAHTSPGAVVIDGTTVWVSNWAVDDTPGPGAGEPKLGRTVGVTAIDATTNQIVHRVPSAGYPVSGMLPRDGSLYLVGGDYRTHTSVLIRTDWPYQVLGSVRPVGGNSFDVVAADGQLWVPSFDEHVVYVLPEDGDEDR
jgi:hypothetical protein